MHSINFLFELFKRLLRLYLNFNLLIAYRAFPLTLLLILLIVFIIGVLVLHLFILTLIYLKSFGWNSAEFFGFPLVTPAEGIYARVELGAVYLLGIIVMLLVLLVRQHN
jgi:hypothetical protein